MMHRQYIELIKENINYDHHMKYDGYGEKELYDELFGIICEVVCVKRNQSELQVRIIRMNL